MHLQVPVNAVASWVESSFRSAFRDVDVGSDDVVVANHIDLGVIGDMVLALESLLRC